MGQWERESVARYREAVLSVLADVVADLIAGRIEGRRKG